MKTATKREASDTLRIRIETSADGLAGIPVEEFGDVLLELVSDEYPEAWIEIEISERDDRASRVRVSPLPETNELDRDGEEIEQRVLEIVRVEAFDEACQRGSIPEDACPGCACRPGDGPTKGCAEPLGCAASLLLEILDETGELEATCTLAEFREANAETFDEADFAKIAALAKGESIDVGGGAAPAMIIRAA